MEGALETQKQNERWCNLKSPFQFMVLLIHNIIRKAVTNNAIAKTNHYSNIEVVSQY